MLDGSTDEECVGEVISYVRCIKDNRVRNVFLSVVPPESAAADGCMCMEAFEKELQKRGHLDLLFSS
jgi:hypothetical protein